MEKGDGGGWGWGGANMVLCKGQMVQEKHVTKNGVIEGYERRRVHLCVCLTVSG